MKANSIHPPSGLALGLAALFCAGFLPLGSRGYAGTIDESCLAKLKQEGPPRWSEAAKLMNDIEVECQQTTLTKSVGDNKKPIRREVKHTWKVSWDPAHSRRLIELYTVDLGVRSRRVINPEYRFQVAQTSKGGPWQIASGRKGEGEFDKYEAHEKDYIWAISSTYRLIGIPLDEILNGKEFKITSAKYLPKEESGEPRIRLEADYLGGKGSYRRPGASYWVEIDPNNSWLITRGGLKIPGKNIEESQRLTFHDSANLIRCPATLHYNRTASDEPSTIDEQYLFNRATKASLPDAEYYLAHYGIPESVLETTAPRLTFRIFVSILGALGLAAALILSRRAKNRQATPHPA